MTRIPASQSTCPYCGTKLATAPSRKRRCPSCKQVMYVKTGPDDIDYAVTEDEVRIIKRERRKYNESTRVISWVSKTDIIELLRCEYRVFIAHKLGQQPAEFIDSEFIKSIMERGSTFEDNVVSELPFKEVGSIHEVIDEQVLFRSTEMVENRNLGIRGIIDLINTEHGKLYPIEIKSHKYLEESDRLELAFYWELLQPLRKGNPIPKGYVWLNTGEIVEVIISEDDFVQLDSLIQRVRLVKALGTEPIIGVECKVCTLKDACLSDVYKRGGVSLIHGIADFRQKQLYELGIKDIHTLARADAGNLYDEWKSFPFAPGASEIQKMIVHAKSWIELRPIYFGKQNFPIDNEFIIIDLEYDPVSLIWLVGMLIVNSEDVECHQFFADSANQEKVILTKMLVILEKYSNLTILTWYGLGADLPQLEKAWRKHALPSQSLHKFEEKHFDLYQFTLNNCRFPLKSFGLKEIGRHLGFTRKHDDIDGLVALSMYNQYLALPKKNEKERLEIKNKLLEYNKEDLEATLHVLRQLKVISGLIY